MSRRSLENPKRATRRETPLSGSSRVDGPPLPIAASSRRTVSSPFPNTSKDPTKQNGYTECGRHSDDWLFGGVSVSESVKKLWEQTVGGNGLDKARVRHTYLKPKPQNSAQNVDKTDQWPPVTSTVNPTHAHPSQKPTPSISSLIISLGGVLSHRPKEVQSSFRRPHGNAAEIQASSTQASSSDSSTDPTTPNLPENIGAQAQNAPSQEQPTLQQHTLASIMATHANVEESQTLPTLNTTEEMGNFTKNHSRSTCDSSTISQSKSITDSTCSEDETDWEEDSDGDWTPLCDLLDPRHIDIGEAENNESFASGQMTSTKAQLVDRLMEDFWPIFNQRWRPGLRHRGTTPDSSSSSSNSTPPRRGLSKGKGVKRFRGDGDEEDPGEESRKGSKRRFESSEPLDATENTSPFACPFRKHNPRKYCIRNWARCALTAQSTVARVKGHLYKYHLVHQCQRCKDVFVSEEELDIHIEAEEGCNSKTTEPVEGITLKMKEKLRSRKKAYPGQTEAERWKEIYQILFPGEAVPDPYFEPVRDHEDDEPQYPDPITLTDYEAYLRRVLPQFVRSDLEMVVNTEIQPIEEQLRSRIFQVIEEAQNRAFLSYRAMLNIDSNAQSPPGGISAIEFESSQQTPLERSSQSRLRTMDAGPSSNTAQSGIFSSNGDCRISLDSGYISNISRSSLPQDTSERNSDDMLGSSEIQHEAAMHSEDLLETGLAQSICLEDNTAVALPQRSQNMDDPGFGQASEAQEGYSTDEPLLPFDEDWASRIDDLGTSWLDDTTLWQN